MTEQTVPQRQPVAGDIWLGLHGPDFMRSGEGWVQIETGLSLEAKQALLLAGWGSRWREAALSAALQSGLQPNRDDLVESQTAAPVNRRPYDRHTG